MPISRGDFEKGDRESTDLVLDFLSSNYRSAYNLDELAEMLTSAGKSLTKKSVEGLLSALEYGGRVRSRVMDGVTYYRYSKVAGLKLI